ncbi:hypothetical protein A2671_01455 [Candidatus Kaiserbacteria bacterium RIFCSPHIGHO2_01_FULL_49_13]|uniref:Isoleucine--tRNA ligase n=1 Tax=Candidatus Kaiserbacteria bacterium RIFCSPHIGHO2_01_FULL_49_13 TaxID=1798477 RepID=A0A1F6CEB8_9BACT|nr:MAG: hypothetical protein A2671_01455 [Candidatus Kaiserbacteria bacterium RIFCSPHIGHO2_01_FULL_49_13]
MAEDPTKAKNETVEREEKTLEFWNTNNIFRKSEEKPAPEGEFVFYDGPPFATGLPHYGHILAGTIKDAIPRYKTMRGFRVRRRWGWDGHGLPLENQIEEELNIKTKRDIEKLGVERFNRAARERVLRYADDWKKIIPRTGRWVDMEHDYKTIDSSYTESVWWAFKKLHDQGLVYEGFKAMQLCPRCGTTLSNFEVSQGYKEITDLAITVKFELLEEPGTAFLAWTTTPWTLPGNMALAVNPEAAYVKISMGDERFILAKERLASIEGAYEVLGEFSGKELVGKKYRPIFDYYKEAAIKNIENAWRVYAAGFVTMGEGTGIVHIAPAFGEDDLLLAQQEDIPIVHHVNVDGTIKPEIRELAGMQAKPKEDPTRTDVEVLKLLVQKNLLYKKEKIIHSYPHCWRCETPLLNYAASSWFVQVTKIRDKLVAENKKISWIPEDIKEGRFGKWLENARDWAISRSRYWGAPIPVWKDVEGRQVIIGSIAELKARIKKSGNRYFVLRHGEAEHNVAAIASSRVDAPYHLTDVGKEKIQEVARQFKQEGVDYIFASPLMRTRETSEILRSELDLPSDRVIFDDRLREVNFGEFEGRLAREYNAYLSLEEKFVQPPKGGETIQAVKERVGALLDEVEKSYTGKKILFVTHEYPAWLLTGAALGANVAESIELKKILGNFDAPGECRELPFVPIPHNERYELDLHRPYIDSIQLLDEGGKPLTRVSDVFDCWFESGSMPFASNHYPFENLETFNPEGGIFKRRRGFPADFIAEGLDQTRGWFYSLLVLGVALFNHAPFRTVIVNGIILAEDGRKMSKRLKNYPEVLEVAHRYGADALRYFLLASPLVRGEDFNFSEKGLSEAGNKIVGRLNNILAFYSLYHTSFSSKEVSSTHPLDRWIIARLKELKGEVTAGMEKYELDRATRPISGFIDDFSTWYIRRSRDRFKREGADKEAALATTRMVLRELAKVTAPFVPFIAEHIYQNVRDADDPESVHLVDWPMIPEVTATEETLLDAMAEVRAIVSRALEARAAAGLKVRQPLPRLTLKVSKLAFEQDLLALIEDEVNVKEVVFDDHISGDLVLDTAVSDELREEGAIRDLLRYLQDRRKQKGLAPGERVALEIGADVYGKALLKKFEEQILQTVNASSLALRDFSSTEERVEIGGHRYTIILHV